MHFDSHCLTYTTFTLLLTSLSVPTLSAIYRISLPSLSTLRYLKYYHLCFACHLREGSLKIYWYKRCWICFSGGVRPGYCDLVFNSLMASTFYPMSPTCTSSLEAWSLSAILGIQRWRLATWTHSRRTGSNKTEEKQTNKTENRWTLVVIIL